MEHLTKVESEALVKDFRADAAAAPADIKDVFCKAWPLAKAGIEAALKIIKNPVVVLVLKGAEAAGDALFTALGCPGEAANHKPTAKQIRENAEQAGLSISEQEAAELERGKKVPLRENQVRALGGCSGIKIVDLGHGCGLYLIPFPPQVSVCCET